MSPFKSILLHVDDSPHMAARLRAADALARQHHARITALFAVTPLYAGDSHGFDEVAAASAGVPDLETRRRQRAESLYLMTGGRSMPHVSWAEVTREPVLEAFTYQALHVDLLILGQHDARTRNVPTHFPEAMLMASGKPGWIIPHDGTTSATPTSVLVAWKPSKEAARAVSASLPFLRNAQQVHVACWTRVPSADRASGLDIEQHLQAHGVKPTMHRYQDEPGDLGQRLLSLAADVGAELLVMGCYGRGRAREFMLGGVTRTVLKSMNVPVFMAH